MQEFARLLGGNEEYHFQYLLDADGNPYPAPDTPAGQLEAVLLLQNIARRQVASTELGVDGHQVHLSTVFLVFNHAFEAGAPPILYESMLFVDGVNISGSQRRYETQALAEVGHQAILDQVREIVAMLHTALPEPIAQE